MVKGSDDRRDGDDNFDDDKMLISYDDVDTNLLPSDCQITNLSGKLILECCGDEYQMVMSD